MLLSHTQTREFTNPFLAVKKPNLQDVLIFTIEKRLGKFSHFYILWIELECKNNIKLLVGSLRFFWYKKSMHSFFKSHIKMSESTQKTLLFDNWIWHLEYTFLTLTCHFKCFGQREHLFLTWCQIRCTLSSWKVSSCLILIFMTFKHFPFSHFLLIVENV